MTVTSMHKCAVVIAMGVFFSISLAQAEGDPARSGENHTDWSADISIGAEHDSSVVIDDIDLFSRRGDTALKIRGKLSGVWKRGAQTQWKGDYIFSQRTYADLSDFDQRSHLFRAGVTSKAGAWQYGLDFRYASADIGGNAFLHASHISPNVSRFFGANWFGQFRYTYARERYSKRASRNAEKHRMDADLYYFFDGPKSYIVLGLDAQNSEAQLKQFGYRAIGPSLAYIKYTELFGRDLRFNLRWRYENRKYNDVSILIDETREDARHRINAEARLMLGADIYIAGDIRLGDYQSNLIDADYSEEVMGLRIGRTF